MIEKYFEWKAIEYFAGWGIIIAVAIMIAIGALIVWIYKKMCDRQKKRLDRMMKKWEEEESRNEEQNKWYWQQALKGEHIWRHGN